MLAIITIITIGLAVGIMMLLAASILSSHISSMETDTIADDSFIEQQDPESPAGTFSP